jgi:hypothetical protein
MEEFGQTRSDAWCGSLMMINICEGQVPQLYASWITMFRHELCLGRLRCELMFEGAGISSSSNFYDFQMSVRKTSVRYALLHAILCVLRSFGSPAVLDPPAPTLRPHPVFDHLLSSALGYGHVAMCHRRACDPRKITSLGSMYNNTACIHALHCIMFEYWCDKLILKYRVFYKLRFERESQTRWVDYY